MWQDFKEFAFKGNVLDLAVAVVIGTAFGKIVTSFVENIIMPLVGVLLRGVNFEDLTYPVGEINIQYGIFIQSVFDFFVITLSIFLFIRFAMRFKRKKEVEVIKLGKKVNVQESLLTEIRDLLKAQHKK